MLDYFKYFDLVCFTYNLQFMLYAKTLAFFAPTKRIFYTRYNFHFLKYSEEDKLRIKIKHTTSIHKLKQVYLSQIKRFSSSVYAVTCDHIVELLSKEKFIMEKQDAQFLDIFIEKLKNLNKMEMTPSNMASIVEMNQLFIQKSKYYNKSLEEFANILQAKLSQQKHLEDLDLKQITQLYAKMSTQRKDTNKISEKILQLLKVNLSMIEFEDSNRSFIFRKILQGMKQQLKLTSIQVKILELLIIFMKQTFTQMTLQQIATIALYLNESILLQGITKHCTKQKQIQCFETIQNFKSMTIKNFNQLNSGWILFALKYRTFLQMNAQQKDFYQAILKSVLERLEKLDLSNSVEAENLFYYCRQLNRQGIKYPVQDNEKNYEIILKMVQKIAENSMNQLNNLLVKILYDEFFPSDLTQRIFRLIRTNPGIPWKFTLLHYFLTNSDKDLTQILLAKIQTCKHSIEQRTLDNEFFAMSSLISKVSKLNPNNIVLSELKTAIDTRILSLNLMERNLIITGQNRQVIAQFHKHYAKLYYSNNLEPYILSKPLLVQKYFGYLFRVLSNAQIDKILSKFQIKQKLQIIINNYRNQKIKGPIDARYIQKLLELFDIVLNISTILKKRGGMFKSKQILRFGYLDLVQELYSYQMLKIVLVDKGNISQSYMRIIIKIVYIYKNFELSFQQLIKNLLLDVFLNPYFENLKNSTLFLELLYEHFAFDSQFLQQFPCGIALLIKYNVIKDCSMIENISTAFGKSVLHKSQFFKTHNYTTLQLQLNETLADEQIQKIMSKIKYMQFDAIEQCIICFNLQNSKKSHQLIKLLCSEYQKKLQNEMKIVKLAALMNNLFSLTKRFRKYEEFYNPILLAIQKNCIRYFENYHLKDHLEVARQLQLSSLIISQTYCQKICDVLLKYNPNIREELGTSLLFPIKPESIVNFFKHFVKFK